MDTTKERAQFEKWVTEMEPAHADSNLERLTGGGYKVHNVAMWWFAWMARAEQSTEMLEISICPRCEGTGRYNYKACAICAGTGRIGPDGESYKPVAEAPRPVQDEPADFSIDKDQQCRALVESREWRGCQKAKGHTGKCDPNGYELAPRPVGTPPTNIPAEQPADFDGWERYWASLDKDYQDKLTSTGGLDAARAWFTIGSVWGHDGPVGTPEKGGL